MSRPRPVAEWERLEYRALMVLTDHVGRAQAIGMGELFEKVFDKPYENRINHTKDLRRLVTLLRQKGKRICSVSSKEGGGYYLAAAGSEMQDYTRRLKNSALRKLKVVAVMERVSLPELLAQMALNAEAEAPR